MTAISEADLQQLKEIELEILDEFMRVCKLHNIHYVLSGGTCLGAIRHNGFIPWDDDIDISMSRESYEALSLACKSDLSDEFVFQDFHTEPKCGLVFGKIRKKGTVLSEDYSHHIDMSQGVWIDIFPYDAVPDDPAARLKHIKSVNLLKNLYIVKCGYKCPPNKSIQFRFAYQVARFATVFIPLNYLIRKLDKLMKAFSSTETSSAYPYGGAYGPEVETIPAVMLSEIKEVSFEGRSCTVFEDYDKYLKSLYGDYMKLPPVEKRTSGAHRIHQFKPYD